MKKFWNETKDYIIIIIAVLLIRTFIMTPALVEGSSMDNTLKDGQLVIINKYIYRFDDIKRFDIVVVNNKEENDKIIKRVIGLPGEIIQYNDNKLFVNGKEIKTDFNIGRTGNFKIVCESDEYFVLGDNREVSKDSRLLGNFNKDDIVGRVKYRLFPFSKFGKIE